MTKLLLSILTITLFSIAALADNRHNKDRHFIRPEDNSKMTKEMKLRYEGMKLKMEAMKREWDKNRTPQQKEKIRLYKKYLDEMPSRKHHAEKQSEKQMRERLHNCLNSQKLSEIQKAKVKKAHAKMKERRAARLKKIKALKLKRGNLKTSMTK